MIATEGMVAEAMRRAAVVWVAPDGGPQAYPVWQLWHEGSAYVLTGGSEQPLPGVGDAGRALVLVRGKDGDRRLQWWAEVTEVPEASPTWDRLVPLLAARRLNSPDGAHAPQRWARECRLLRLTPDGTGRELDHAQ